MAKQMFTARLLTTSLKRVLCVAQAIYRDLRTTSSRRVSVSERSVLRIAAVAHGPHTKSTIRIAALQEGWHLRFVQSPQDALELVGRFPVNFLVYDLESSGGSWHRLCERCVQHGVCFQLVANRATDDLFFSVISAGGLGLLCKPLTSESLIIAMRFARSLTEGQLTAAAHDPTS